jgi:hypothetical protein
MKWLLTGLVVAAGFASVAQAADVGLAITEGYGPGNVETCTATWSSDPTAVILVTRDLTRLDGEVWLIDLSQSGHRAPGASWPNGFTVATWPEPEHPGLWNNLYIDDPLHMHLESEWSVATGQNMAQYPNGFPNGVSYFAGQDYNGDFVFASITETAATAAGSATWGSIKSLYRR